MNEVTTQAIVLEQNDSGELNSTYSLYTEKLGLIRAVSKSTRKATSKLNGHLQPMNLVHLRLVNKNFFRITDALLIKNLGLEIKNQNIEEKEKLKKLTEVIGIFSMIKAVAQHEQPDQELWQMLKNSQIVSKNILQVLGLDPDHAICLECESINPEHFLIKEMEYLCSICLRKKIQKTTTSSRLAV